jgi:hypothetical protein
MVNNSDKYNMSLETLPNEIWVPVKGYESYFHVSNLERVKSLGRVRNSKNGSINYWHERMLKGSRVGLGYRGISVRLENNKYATRMVHRMIAEAFIPNPYNKPFINHINGIKDDNRIENLEWCTQQENVQHSYATGLQISNFLGRKDDLSPVAKPLQCIETGVKYHSAAHASRELKLQDAHIASVCRGVRKRTGGLTFKFI